MGQSYSSRRKSVEPKPEWPTIRSGRMSGRALQGLVDGVRVPDGVLEGAAAVVVLAAWRRRWMWYWMRSTPPTCPAALRDEGAAEAVAAGQVAGDVAELGREVLVDEQDVHGLAPPVTRHELGPLPVRLLPPSLRPVVTNVARHPLPVVPERLHPRRRCCRNRAGQGLGRKPGAEGSRLFLRGFGPVMPTP